MYVTRPRHSFKTYTRTCVCVSGWVGSEPRLRHRQQLIEHEVVPRHLTRPPSTLFDGVHQTVPESSVVSCIVSDIVLRPLHREVSALDGPVSPPFFGWSFPRPPLPSWTKRQHSKREFFLCLIPYDLGKDKVDFCERCPHLRY